MNRRAYIRYSLLAIALLLAFIPWIVSVSVEYSLASQLKQRGMTEVSADTVWLNPYSGVVEIENLRFSHDTAAYQLTSLELDLTLTDLFRRKIRVHGIGLKGADIHVQQTPTGELLIDGLSMSASPQTTPDQAPVQADESEQAGPTWQFALDSVDISDIRIHVDLPDIDFQANLEKFIIDKLDTGQAKAAQAQAVLSVSHLALPGADFEGAMTLAYDTALSLERRSQNQWQLSALTQLTITDVLLKAQGFEVALPKTSLDLDSALSLNETLAYETSFTARSSEWRIKSMIDDTVIISLDQLELASSLKEQAIAVDSLSLTGLDILPSKDDALPALLTGGNINVSALEWLMPTEQTPATLTIASIALPKASISVLRSASGDLPQLAVIEALAPANGSAEPAEPVTQVQADSAPAMLVAIEKITLGPDVFINIKDKSVKPSFQESVAIQSLEINQLSLTDAEKNSTLSLLIGLSSDAQVKLTGEFNIAAQRADMELNLQDYQALTLSGYAQQATGYALETGTFNVVSSVHVADEKLNTDNSIFIDQLNLRASHQDKTTQFAHKLTMPLDQALDLLRDNNNEIRLNVPVSGALHDPDVDLKQVINKALGSAMKKASLTMLKTLLQPYGTLVSIAQAAGKEATKVRLNPVPFDVGASELTVAAQDYASKISDLINQRESLVIKLCGVTNTQDLNSLVQQAATAKTAAGKNTTAEAKSDAPPADPLVLYHDQLQALSHARANALKNHLQKNLSVNPKQLLMCLPSHATDAKAISGVTLTI